jgi:hypothetical protein
MIGKLHAVASWHTARRKGSWIPASSGGRCWRAASAVPGRQRSVRQLLLADLCGWLDGLPLAQEQGMLLQVIVETEWWRALSHRGKMAG